jgi:pimeloyl-ACP methyl ester carboxylesterase
VNSKDAEEYWRDIGTVSAALGLRSPVLVGHSAGGYAVTAFAASGGECAGWRRRPPPPAAHPPRGPPAPPTPPPPRPAPRGGRLRILSRNSPAGHFSVMGTNGFAGRPWKRLGPPDVRIPEN